MVTARLLVEPVGQDTSGLGDYDFEILPRMGETVRLFFKDRGEVYKVLRVEHQFVDHTKPADLLIVLQSTEPHEIEYRAGQMFE